MAGVPRLLRSVAGVAAVALAAADRITQKQKDAVAAASADKDTHVQNSVQVFHPGYAAVHVTRLHRYDHSGLRAMEEEEERWARGDLGPRPRAPSAAAFSDEGGASGRSFLQVSPKQAAALAHHQWQALLQLAEHRNITIDHTHTRPRARSQRLFDYHNKLKFVPKDHPAVTRLDSLDSQYVGPIGVGTVRYPSNCVGSGGESLIFMDSTEDEMAINATVTGAAGCHVLNQAKIWVVFDTGSTNLWVSSDLCKTGPCANSGRSRYDHVASNTYADPKHGVYLNIEFGTGKISGPQGVDDFHVGPFTVFKQTFGMIEVQEGKVFEEVPFEGILGLAFPKMSANGVRAFFDSIIAQKALENNEFAFYFSRDNPSANAILWGGVDKKFYHDSIEYFHVDDPYYWSTNLKSFRIGDKEYFGSHPKGSGLLQTDNWAERTPKAIVDTGTTFFTAEAELFGKIMQRLPTMQCRDVTGSSHPPIAFTLERVDGEPRDFVLTHNQYMTSQGEGDESDTCSPAFMKIDIPHQHGPAMVLGEVFLRHYFAVFDRGTKGNPDATTGARLGFAKARHGLDVNEHLRDLTPNQPTFHRSRGSESTDEKSTPDESTGSADDEPGP